MGGFNLFRSSAQEAGGCRTTATHEGERQDALKARVYPASMPAGGESGAFLFSPSWTDNLITTHH